MNSYYERISIKKYKISTNFIKKIQIINNYSTILIKIQNFYKFYQKKKYKLLTISTNYSTILIKIQNYSTNLFNNYSTNLNKNTIISHLFI